MPSPGTEHTGLRFAHSHSHITGVQQHAKELVGVGNVAGDGLSLLSTLGGVGAAAGTAAAVSNPVGWLFAPAVFLMVGSRLPLVFSGMTKDSRIAAEEREAREHVWNMQHPHAPKPLHEKMKEDAAKVLHPGEHPVETTAALSMLSGAVFLAMGIGGLIASGGTGALALPVINTVLGVLMIGSRANEIFADDKYEREERAQWEERKAEQDSLRFGQSHSKQVGAEGPVKGLFHAIENNPEKVSGMMGVMTSVTMLAAAVVSQNWVYAAAAMLYIGSSVTYSMFVRREENLQPEQAEERPKTHVERLAARGHMRRGQDGHSHVARLQAERDHGMDDAQPSLG